MTEGESGKEGVEVKPTNKLLAIFEILDKKAEAEGREITNEDIAGAWEQVERSDLFEVTRLANQAQERSTLRKLFKPKKRGGIR